MFELKGSCVALDARRSPNCPTVAASIAFPIDRCRYRVVLLRKICASLRELSRRFWSIGPCRPFQVNFAQNEIAISSPPGTEARQAFVGQSFQHDPGNVRESGLGHNAVVGLAIGS